MSTPRVRIAPSPTGSPQIGNARTALFNYLFAKHYGGTFIVRIEDTDLERSDRRYESEIFEGFRWLEIDADENPEVGGPYGPYRTTERIESHKKYLQQLLDAGNAFHCFHSKDELEQEKTAFLREKKSPLHRCSYRTYKLSEVLKLKEIKPESIIRFKVPLGKAITFNDLIRGELSFNTDMIEDFSLARTIDTPLYNFAVTIDDYAMQISHVIRGEEHIANTPKQILIAQALDFLQPVFAHLPLILAPDRSKLSKRHGAMSVLEYRQLGYLPEALFNFIALLGWNPGDDREILSKDELIAAFSLEKVQKSGAIFDFVKLDWMNGEYIRKKPLAELVALCLRFIQDFLQFPIPNAEFSMDYIEKVVALEQPRLKKLSEIGERVEYFFRTPSYTKELLQWKNIEDIELLASLHHSEKIIEQIPTGSSKDTIEKMFLDEIGESDKGPLLWPLRVALSGKKASPGPFEIMEVLGVEESLKRIKAAQQLIRNVNQV